MTEIAVEKIEKSVHPLLSPDKLGDLGKGTEGINKDYSLGEFLVFVRDNKGLNQNFEIETKPKDSLSISCSKPPRYDPWKSFILITNQLKDNEPKKIAEGQRLEYNFIGFLGLLPIEVNGKKTFLDRKKSIKLEVENTGEELYAIIKHVIGEKTNGWIINGKGFVERTLGDVMARYKKTNTLNPKLIHPKKPAGAKV